MTISKKFTVYSIMLFFISYAALCMYTLSTTWEKLNPSQGDCGMTP